MEPQHVVDVEEDHDRRRFSLETPMRLRQRRQQQQPPVTSSPVVGDEDELRRLGGLREVEVLGRLMPTRRVISLSRILRPNRRLRS